MIMFNCGHPDNKALTPETVGQRETTLIDWTDEVGYVGKEWNHLVGYSTPSADARLIHFTQGVPAYPETQMSEYAKSWERSAMQSLKTVPWAALMGRSVHTREQDGKLVPKLYPHDQAPPEDAFELPKQDK